MSAYEQPVQASTKYYGPETGTNEVFGSETAAAEKPFSDARQHEWADVLEDLERYY